MAPPPTAARPPAYALAEVARHNRRQSLWLVIGGKVYDVTGYIHRHPGGAAVLLQLGGKDATEAALAAHKGSELPLHMMKEFCIGTALQPNEGEFRGWDVVSAASSVDGRSALASVLPASELPLDLGEGPVAGEHALVAVSDLLYQRLRGDPRLADAFGRDPPHDVAARLRGLLGGAFGAGGPWPAVRVSPELAEALAEELVGALEEALRRPRPVARPAGGEDAVASALAAVAEGDNPRLGRFFGLLQTAADAATAGPEKEVACLASTAALQEAYYAEAQAAFWEKEEEEEQEEEQEEEGEGWYDDEGAGPEVPEEEINSQSFEELVLEPGQAQEVQAAWAAFLSGASSKEAAGEAVYSAIFEAGPTLQGLFTTPRAVMAMNFIGSLGRIVEALAEPRDLRVIVETLGFQHLDREVSAPRVAVFRDAILELLAAELDARLTPGALQGLRRALNYVGGAFIYVRLNYTVRLRILAASWARANHRNTGEAPAAEPLAAGEEASATLQEEQPRQAGGQAKRSWSWAAARRGSAGPSQRRSGGDAEEGGEHGEAAGSIEGFKNAFVPKTFFEMFSFNAAVMGCGGCTWMAEVLGSFEAIVSNVSNTSRLQEECDILSLRLAKLKGASKLPQFRAVMLASLRSLLPKDWDSEHEVAWCWLWENVDRMLQALMGRPAKYEKALAKFVGQLDDGTRGRLRNGIYQKFFAAAVRGQDYFKQSTTRLHFIADKVLEMSLEMYRTPKKMVEDLSALGLRHVGYGIPTELFGPFVTACIEVVTEIVVSQGLAGRGVEESFRWSLGLVSRVLVRTITEGSTVVMRAINANSARQLRKAVACAPRGDRAGWLLRITVGTQSISPLLCALGSGSLEAADAMLADLLTIRADRDRYYYGADELFARHPDIVKRLLGDAPGLLPRLLDGLVWRSRTAVRGHRRVNYYLRHLLQDANGDFAKTLRWLSRAKNPKFVCHPIIVLLSDTVWSRLAYKSFLVGKMWSIFMLLVFVLSQSVLSGPAARGVVWANGSSGRAALALCRLVTYVGSLGAHLVHHVRRSYRAVRAKETAPLLGLPVPFYLRDLPQERLSAVLVAVLCAMLASEPILRCLARGAAGNYEGAGLFTTHCPETEQSAPWYSGLSAIAMGLYFMLLLDLTALSTDLSAFVLVCRHMLPEVLLTIMALVFLLLAFGCGVSALGHRNPDFASIPTGALSLAEIALRMYSARGFEALDGEPVLLAATFAFTIAAGVFVLNLLVAQLNSSYLEVYEDMVGFARLSRAELVCATLPSVPKRRWLRLLDMLRLDERLEFNEGDVGVAGGIQVLEPAALHPTTADAIRRFGGSTDPAMQWPAEEREKGEEDRYERLERLLQKTVKRLGNSRRHRGGSGASGTFGSRSGGGGGSSAGGSSQSDASGIS